MPTTLRIVLAAVLVATGLALLAVATLGGTGRLRRNRFAGVRTPASLHSGPAFAAANRVAAPLLAAAGAVSAVGGVALATVPGSATAWVLTSVTVVGTVVLAGLGGALGDRAAAAVVAATPAPETCGGACAGCDLVAGCRPSSATGAPPVSGAAEAGGGENAATSPASPDRP